MRAKRAKELEAYSKTSLINMIIDCEDYIERLKTTRTANANEQWAWRVLVEMGAKQVDLGSKPALDLRSVRWRTRKRFGLFLQAFLEVGGRSGAVRRHVDRNGCPVFVVRDK